MFQPVVHAAINLVIVRHGCHKMAVRCRYRQTIDRRRRARRSERVAVRLLRDGLDLLMQRRDEIVHFRTKVGNAGNLECSDPG